MTRRYNMSMRCSKDQLLVERSGHPDRAILPEVKDVFFEPGRPRTRRIFLRDSTGAISGFIDRREARESYGGGSASIASPAAMRRGIAFQDKTCTLKDRAITSSIRSWSRTCNR